MKQGELLKFMACVICATLGVMIHLWAARQPNEIQVRRRLVAGAIAAKSLFFVSVLALELPFANPVDPTLHYLPETRALLDGQLPYRDFISVYSPFFGLLLAPAVAVWDSLATVSAVMIAGEVVMLALYLRDRPGSIQRWRCATLYALSPIAVYWIGVGYHSGLLATAAMASLVLAVRGRHLAGGLAAAVGFLSTKLTAVIAWPAILFIDGSRSAILRRAIGMASAWGVMAGLYAAGLNVLMPLELEIFRSSPGNIPNILITAFPNLAAAPIMRPLPLLLLAALWLPGAIAIVGATLSRPEPSAERRFDRAAAFIAFSSLAFMMASRKSYTFYGPMFLPFLLHAVLADGRRLRWHLLALIVLGSTTTMEIALTSEYLINGKEAFRVPSALLDAVLVSAYAWLAWCCLGAALRAGRALPVPAGQTV